MDKENQWQNIFILNLFNEVTGGYGEELMRALDNVEKARDRVLTPTPSDGLIPGQPEPPRIDNLGS